MFDHLLDPAAWFTLRSAEVGGLSGKFIFGFFVLLFVLGIVCRIVSSHKTEDRYMRGLGERLGVMFLTMGFLGVLLYFFSFERISLFGARFWYVLWTAGLIVWITRLIRVAMVTIPQEKKRAQQQAEQQKYFPGRKRN